MPVAPWIVLRPLFRDAPQRRLLALSRLPVVPPLEHGDLSRELRLVEVRRCLHARGQPGVPLQKSRLDVSNIYPK